MPYYLLDTANELHQINTHDAGLDKITLQLPSGVYTTFRTYEGVKALYLPQHMDRLEESARLAHVPIKLNRRVVRQTIRLALRAEKGSEFRVRLVVDLVENAGALYVLTEPLNIIPDDVYRHGVSAIFDPARRQEPLKKGTDFIHVADKARATFPLGVNEALMVDDYDGILEGLSSNFFAVKNGVVYTAGVGILNGITRTLVLDEIRKSGISIIYEAIRRTEIGQIHEAFITSASRGVLPVIDIEGQTIGDGRPGSITLKLHHLYEQRIKTEVRAI